MNKIKIINNKIIDNNKKTNIFINDYSKKSYLNIDKNDVYIYIPSNVDTSLELDCEYNNFKQDIIILVDINSELKIFEYKTGTNVDGNIKYILLENAKLIINKFCNISNLEENIDILLDGINSKVEYHFSTISNSNKIYNIYIKHNNKKTYSNIVAHGVSFNNAVLNFNVNGTINEGNSESILNQDNRIILLGENKSIINPKLFIYDNNIEAKHSAVIGKFSDMDLFYLKSRGINENNAIKILAKGFLLGILDVPGSKNYEILKSITAYWE